MMKQRFIDGKDPDFGKNIRFCWNILHWVNSDYANFDKSIIYDHEDDKMKTENWFDEDSDDETPVQDTQNSLVNQNVVQEDEDSEDDYMKMDLSKL